MGVSVAHKETDLDLCVRGDAMEIFRFFLLGLKSTCVRKLEIGTDHFLAAHVRIFSLLNILIKAVILNS